MLKKMTCVGLLFGLFHLAVPKGHADGWCTVTFYGSSNGWWYYQMELKDISGCNFHTMKCDSAQTIDSREPGCYMAGTCTPHSLPSGCYYWFPMNEDQEIIEALGIDPSQVGFY